MPQVAKINGYRIGGICTDDCEQYCNAYNGTATYLSYTNTSWKSGSTYNLDVSGICKAGDDCYYEMYVYGDLQSSATSGQQTSLLAYTKESDSATTNLIEANLCEAIPRTSAYVRQGNMARLIVPPNNRKIYLKNNRTGTSNSTIHFYVRAVKRLAKSPTTNKLTKISANNEEYIPAGNQFAGEVVAHNNEVLWNGTIAQSGTRLVNLSEKLDSLTDWDCHFLISASTASTSGNTCTIGIYAGNLEVSESNRYARTYVVARSASTWVNDMNINCKIPANDLYLKLYNGGNATVTVSVLIGARRRASTNKHNDSNMGYISKITSTLSGQSESYYFNPIDNEVCDSPFVPSIYDFSDPVEAIQTGSWPNQQFNITNYLPTNNEYYLLYFTGRIENYTDGGASIARPYLDSYTDAGYTSRIERVTIGSIKNGSTSTKGRAGCCGTIVCKQNANGKLYFDAVANSGGTSTGWLNFYGYRKLSKNTSYA